ncbi:DUF418 domain-containing protein [Flagellimonas sp. HMM57]|uniref:DUF418 domain-containing protein n=1 Tax=unclassified Flagellimonas TaxID=2644544 RepID=UPI0013D85AF7|nr:MULTISPECIES: DUF418 domain-containing protein [unclassified Flagellimonas]UII74777.1 DUF418 domain-containing protein [Flagellimonas sp. HMM57]
MRDSAQDIIQETKERILGYDVARALAVFIMVIVNFNLVLAKTDNNHTLSKALNFLQGKGAALFVVLAGAGISLMIRNNLYDGNKTRLTNKKRLLFRRAAFLFVFGLLYTPIWPADILHFYGCYIAIGALLMTTRSFNLWLLIVSLIVVYPFLLDFVDYEKGWNWKTVEYLDFWSIGGFIRNLLVNGFHPVFPWVAFLFAGIWLGRQSLISNGRRNVIFWSSLVIFVLVQIISKRLVDVSIIQTDLKLQDIVALYGTKPMPPMPLFMVSGVSWSYLIILICIWATERFNRKSQLRFVVKTGQMAFTHYILHVMAGIMGAYLVFGENQLSVQTTLLYSLMFCAFSVCLSHFWGKKFKKGPMSLLLRYITG